MKPACAAGIAAALVFVAPAIQAQVEQSAEQGGVQVFLENDYFSARHKTDQWYTNGIKAVWTQPTEEFPEAIRELANDWLSSSCRNAGCKKNIGIVLGQDMFTPRDIQNPNPQPNDRPWAGWLYTGLVGQVTGEAWQRTLEFDLGVIGPWSGAESAQTRWHQMIGSPGPHGWDNQLKTELGVMLQYRYKRRYANNANTFDFVPLVGGALGNVMTYGAAGGMLRWGENLSGFGQDRTPQETRTTRRGDERTIFPGINEWSVFLRTEERAVLRNIFLDGNTFKDSPSVPKRLLVADLAVGVSLRFSQRYIFTYQYILRSQEFRGQSGPASFGSLMLGYEY